MGANSTSFQPKHKKCGGRKAGTPNKLTQAHLNRIDQFFEHTWEEFITEVWPELSPKDKKDTIVSLMNYRYPKLTSVDVRSTVKTEESTIGMLSAHVDDAALVIKK